MSVFNRALFVINETYSDEYVKQHMTPLKVTKALADAGLLTPDLPQVTHRAGMGAAGTEYPMSSGRFARVNLQNSAEYLWTMFNPGSVELIHNRGKRTDAKGRKWPDTRDMYLTPDAAREIAYTLLAAANHAEGDTDD